MKKKITAPLLSILSAGSLTAQSVEPEMADVFRAEGKIYVVVAVCLVVLFGLVAYLTTLDRRLRKLEQSFGKKH